MKKKKVGRPATGKTKKIKMSYVSDEVHKFYINAGNGSYSKGLQVIKEKMETLKN